VVCEEAIKHYWGDPGLFFLEMLVACGFFQVGFAIRQHGESVRGVEC
jgi:hypothetical protein